MVQWLGLHALSAKGLVLIPSQGTRIHKPDDAAKKEKIKQ